MDAIALQHVSFTYEDLSHAKGASAQRALTDVSLSVPQGQFLCVIGHSGGGKSTLLRLISGLSLPTEGTVLIDGNPVHGPGMDRSIVFQDYALFPWMRVKRNVEFGIEQANTVLGRGLSKHAIAQRADEYLRLVNMQDACNKYPYQLSGGMQQRVAIARALAMDTQIVLFDEPFGALDVKTRRSLQTLVSSLWARSESPKTTVFVTHDISEAILLADRVVFVDAGQITADFMVDLPRPRTVENLAHNAQAQEIEKRLTDLFYESSPAEDEEEIALSLDAVLGQEVRPWQRF